MNVQQEGFISTGRISAGVAVPHDSGSYSGSGVGRRCGLMNPLTLIGPSVWLALLPLLP